MLKINDIRSDNSKQLKDIELDGFFYYKDILCRRVHTAGGAAISVLTTNGEDDIAAMLMTTGEVIGIDRYSWVEPIRDKQIFVEVCD